MEQNPNFMAPPVKEAEFKTLYDVVDLPSKGLFYPNQKSQIFVEHMTAKDEQIILTPGLLRSGKAFDELINKKVKDPDFKNIDLLTCDKNAILMFLRISAYGPYYNVNVTSPFTNDVFKEKIDLLTIKEKVLTVEPNENLEYGYATKDGKHTITFKLLTASKEEEITLRSEAEKGIMNQGIDLSPLDLLVNKISTLDGNSDKPRIKQFVYTLRPLIFKELNKAIDEVTPGLDMVYTYTCPATGKPFQSFVPISTEFFYPES